ncbi:MAG: glutaminyl-peptide cyclotransferase [Longispora sp.]|nr:glutaminyl-peptide cyclotransferase [Longispora sp. (in: high G+C Gram-positive bacteria)]
MTSWAFIGCGAQQEITEQEPTAVTRPTLRVLDSYPHDAGAFTEGLEFTGLTLYESIGKYGVSELRVVDMKSGVVERRVALPENQWAEGMTVVGSHVWQLTYKEQISHKWDRNTFTSVSQGTYTGEGWGLCYQQSKTRLVMSNGSDRLVFRDPKTFTELGSVQVTVPGLDERLRLNELECVGDQVWAVLFPTPRMVRVDITTGHATALVDVSGLLTPDEALNAQDFNGIAAIPDTDTFLLTGKYWPRSFRVRLTEGQ